MLKFNRRVLFTRGGYFVPTTSRVAIFPIHLDPPTLLHREIFLTLLGRNRLPYLSRQQSQKPSSDSNEAATEGVYGFDRYCLEKMLPLSSSLKDSILAPFDDLILVPNTRFPVALRMSTHLSALAVLATRDLPHVHLDFTALENPDEAMPCVYELTQHYPQSSLVHWLHDAYEMQNWRRFTDVKLEVPLLLLKTVSLPLSELKNPIFTDFSGNIDMTSAAEKTTFGISSISFQSNRSNIREKLMPLSKETSSEAINTVKHTEAAIPVPISNSKPRTENISSSSKNPFDEVPISQPFTNIQKDSIALKAKARARRFRGKSRMWWWRQKGGRGDEEVEISKSYTGASGSLWLGGSALSDKDATANFHYNEKELQEGYHSTSLPDRNLGAQAATSEMNQNNVTTPLSSTTDAAKKDGSDNAKMDSAYDKEKSSELFNFTSNVLDKPAESSLSWCERNAHPLRRNVRQLIDELFPAHLFQEDDFDATSRTNDNDLADFSSFGTERSLQPSLATENIRASPNTTTTSNNNNSNNSGNSNNSSNHNHNSNNFNHNHNISTTMEEPITEDSKAPVVEVHTVHRWTGADVRQALWEGEIEPSLVLSDPVLRYIESHGLYRDYRKSSNFSSIYNTSSSGSVWGKKKTGDSSNSAASHSSSSFGKVTPKNDSSTMNLPGLIPRLELHYDKNNLVAREQYEKLKMFRVMEGEEPDLIVPIGGDGYMMHCIRNNWRRFIPFYGVNAGHLGYLLNDISTIDELFSYPLKLHTATMLYCQCEKETETGERAVLSELAFNDAWVERASGQTALIRILVNGDERIRRLRGDGVLVSTAAGSTAYSQALGASPVPVGAPLIQVVGSNVVSPAQWRPAHLDQEDQVEFEVIDTRKRPCRAFVDSVDVGIVTRMLVRSSRVAGITLAFSRSCDLQHKLYLMQFPKAL